MCTFDNRYCDTNMPRSRQLLQSNLIKINENDRNDMTKRTISRRVDFEPNSTSGGIYLCRPIFLNAIVNPNHAI